MSTPSNSTSETRGRWRYLPGVLLLIAGVVGAQWGCLAVCIGRSMEPELYPGDVCLVSRSREPHVGDMVLFGNEGSRRPTLHRVVSVDGKGRLETRGDANTVSDRDVVEPARVRGTVVAVMRLGRWLHY